MDPVLRPRTPVFPIFKLPPELRYEIYELCFPYDNDLSLSSPHAAGATSTNRWIIHAVLWREASVPQIHDGWLAQAGHCICGPNRTTDARCIQCSMNATVTLLQINREVRKEVRSLLANCLQVDLFIPVSRTHRRAPIIIPGYLKMTKRLEVTIYHVDLPFQKEALAGAIASLLTDSEAHLRTVTIDIHHPRQYSDTTQFADHLTQKIEAQTGRSVHKEIAVSVQPFPRVWVHTVRLDFDTFGRPTALASYVPR